jgi:hypothetical protein
MLRRELADDRRRRLADAERDVDPAADRRRRLQRAEGSVYRAATSGCA